MQETPFGGCNMREFNFKASATKLLTNDIVNMPGFIHEYKGHQNLFIGSKTK